MGSRLRRWAKAFVLLGFGLLLGLTLVNAGLQLLGMHGVALYAWTRQMASSEPLRGALERIGVVKPQPGSPAIESGDSAPSAEAWKVERRLLLEMMRDVEQNGGRLILFLASGDVNYSRTLDALCGELAIPYFDLAHVPEFAAGYQRGDYHFRTDGHWNPRGHRRAAELLAEFVLTQMPQWR